MSEEVTPLEAALEIILAQMSEENAEHIKNSTPDDVIMMHFGLGTWIRNNLGLWAGSPLRDFMEARGFGHEDDMSTGIIYALRARLRGEDCIKALELAREQS